MESLNERETYANWIKELSFNPPASENELGQLSKFGALPQDYIGFMRQSNGASGPIGSHYLIIYSTLTACRLNEMKEEDAIEMGNRTRYFFIFGSNGGGLSYAFDLQQEAETIVEVDSLDVGFENTAVRAHSLAEFFKFIYETSNSSSEV
jgi:hypothetical protein